MEMKLVKENLAVYADRMRLADSPLSEAHCALVIKGVLQGLEYIHEQKNLMHRDLKPDNILLMCQ